MCDLTADDFVMLRYYYVAASDRDKVPWRQIPNVGEVIDRLKVKRLIRPHARTYQLTAKGRDCLIDKSVSATRHEEPMPWMIQSSVMDIAVAIKSVDKELKSSPAFDFEQEASIAAAVDKCSQNVFVKTLVQSWYSSDSKAAIAWANRVHKE